MDGDAASLDDFIRLVEAAEETYPYVTAVRLSRLARGEPTWARLTGRMARLVRRGLADGFLLSDRRTRVTRAGDFQPVQIYRLNRRHERVASALLGEPG